MSLSKTSCSDLTPDIISKLGDHNITSVLDLVSSDAELVSSATGIPFKVLLAIRTMVLAQYSSAVMNGAAMYQEVMSSMAILSTGCESIDSLLDGGLYTTEVTEVISRPGDGKTQLCLSCSIQVSHANQQGVLYIDTGGGFDVSRLGDMMETRGCSEQVVCTTLERIRCSQAFDVFELLDLLEDLKQSLNNQTDTFYSKLKLVIIDSITSVISPILGVHQNGHGYMMHVCRALKMLATEYSLAVLVTNNTVKSESGYKPALGKSWSHVPNTRICLTKCQQSHDPADQNGAPVQLRKAILDKSNRQETCSEAHFRINDGGLESVIK